MSELLFAALALCAGAAIAILVLTIRTLRENARWREVAKREHLSIRRN